MSMCGTNKVSHICQNFARLRDLNLVRHVDLIRPVGTIADKVREGRHQERKALGVGDVPVEDVLL